MWSVLSRVVMSAACGLLIVVLLGAAPADAATEPRHALVIGNARYANAPLLNAGNDATAVAQALRRAGFDVNLQLDATQAQMHQALTTFGDRLKGGGAGLFYFAGHGVQLKGRNFLLPVGNDIQREDEVPFKSVDVQQVLDKMESARNRINVVVLDACRDNPFARSSRSTGGAGLSQMDAPIGSLIAFATAPGSVASDGKGAHGLYTQHLLANIERPGTPIEEVFKRTRLGVRLDSNGAQVPWESTSLEGDFFFLPATASAAAAPTLPAPPAAEHIARAERAYELLRQGQLDDAERIFRALASNAHTEVAWMGREGLAELALARGDTQTALTEANDIIARAPTRSAAYLTRGRALAAAGQAAQAQLAVQRAADAQTAADFSWQKAAALLALGNGQRKSDPAAAAKAYERAVREQPQSVEALGNLAVALNESGQSKRAKAVLERAQALDPHDAVTAALLRQTQDLLALEADRTRQQMIDDAVRELSARLRNPAPRPVGAGAADDWTSPMLALSVLPFQDLTPPGAAGHLSGRIGLEAVVQQELMRELQSRGFTLVERRVLDQVLAEAKLGSSELAEADTQIKLGRLLAARLLVSGSLSTAGSAVQTTYRAIDTETTQLALVKRERSAGGSAFDPGQLAAAMADALTATVRDKYPLKGRIVAVEGQQAILNLGSKHGITRGQTFNVLGRGEPIELNGRVLGFKEERIARVTIVDVQDQLSYARISEPRAPLEKNQRVIARSE